MCSRLIPGFVEALESIVEYNDWSSKVISHRFYTDMSPIIEPDILLSVFRVNLWPSFLLSREKDCHHWFHGLGKSSVARALRTYSSTR